MLLVMVIFSAGVKEKTTQKWRHGPHTNGLRQLEVDQVSCVLGASFTVVSDFVDELPSGGESLVSVDVSK